jgi:LysM repeat protein
MLLMVLPLMGQSPSGIKRSSKTEVVEGKKYYLHTVEKSQTLFSIAKAYDITVNDIVVENPGAINGIRPGQVLRIPAQKTVILPPATSTTEKPSPEKNTQTATRESGWIMHTVEAGQTLYSISQKYATTVDYLNQLNPELKTAPLRVGQQIKVPGKTAGALPKPSLQQDKKATETSSTSTVAESEFRENKKTVYSVALMLPLQLTVIENIDLAKTENNEDAFPAKAKAAIEFYEGALLAVDSMRKKGMQVQLYVYDVSESDSQNVDKIMTKPEFNSMDLILGPLDPGPFGKVAEFGLKKGVAVVSPLSPANRVLFRHPQASKVVPSIATQMDQLALHLGKSDTKNIVLVNSGSPKEQNAATAFQNSMNDQRKASGKDSIRTAAGSGVIETYLRKDKPNIVVVPSNSQAFVTGLLLALNGLADSYDITVYGLSSWMGYDNLDAEYMQRLKLHYVSPYFIDYEQVATKKFVNQYKALFKGDASSYAFAGYDVTFYFLNVLNQHGIFFYKKQNTLSGNGLQQKFDFYRPEGESGYENRGVRIVRIEDYKLVRVQ